MRTAADRDGRVRHRAAVRRAAQRTARERCEQRRTHDERAGHDDERRRADLVHQARDDLRTEHRTRAAARRHVAVEPFGEIRPPHVRHRAPEHGNQVEIGRGQRDEIHEGHGSIARIPGESRGQREEHQHERRRHEPRQPAARRTPHEPPVDGQQRRGTHQHRREQDGVVLHAHFERERFAHRPQRVIAAQQAEKARGRHQQCAPFLPANRRATLTAVISASR